VADRAFFVESKRKEDAPKSDGFSDVDYDDVPF
jgi:hypothetical protein